MNMSCDHFSYLWKLLLALAAALLGVNLYRVYILDSHADTLTEWLFYILLFGSLIVQFATRRCRKGQPD
jgi:type II secretory pathway component PulF